MKIESHESIRSNRKIVVHCELLWKRVRMSNRLCVSLSLCGMLCISQSLCSLWKFNTFCIYSSHRAILCFRLITIDMNFLFHFCLRCCTSDLIIQNGSAFALRLPTPVFPLHLLLSVSTQTTGTCLVYLTSQSRPDSSVYISSSVLFLSNKPRISNYLFKPRG